MPGKQLNKVLTILNQTALIWFP